MNNADIYTPLAKKTAITPYSEAIANAVPYIIIAVSLIFLTLMTLKYLKLLLEDDNHNN